jgi:hypothetical protein
MAVLFGSAGETAFFGPHRTTWLEVGSNGQNLIRARGPTQTEAWAESERQARELGMLDVATGRASLGN